MPPGAGEVGYMSGPLSTVWVMVKTGNLPKSVEAPIWIILISAFGLVVGLGESVCDGWRTQQTAS